jgi:hypothetical protein
VLGVAGGLSRAAAEYKNCQSAVSLTKTKTVYDNR